MKNSLKISAVLLVVMITAGSCSRSHKERKEFQQSRAGGHQFAMMHGMRQGNFHGRPRGEDFRRGQAWMDNPGFGPQMREMRRMHNIPDLTDKQKKEIADLRNQQMEEMTKLREENIAKMLSIREEHRKKLMDLLTDEQKKFLEEGNPDTPPPVK